MPEYTYKRAAELGWGVVTALLIVAGETAISFDPAAITDWRTWAIGVGGALVRAVGGAVLAWLGRGVVE